MKELFGCQVGLSDHTLGVGVSVASIAMGATVIEKHFTTSRADGGVDSTFSMEPSEMEALVVETKRAWESLGQVRYGPTNEEKKSMKFRRSIYIVKDLKVGDVLTRDNIRVIRPGYGMAPKYLEKLLGKKVAKELKAGTPLNWDSL